METEKERRLDVQRNIWRGGGGATGGTLTGYVTWDRDLQRKHSHHREAEADTDTDSNEPILSP